MNRDCEIVMDLLSLYAEGIASESTCRLVEEHINRCDHCREALEEMKQNVPLPIQTDAEALVAINRHMKKKKLLRGLTAVLLMVTLFFCLWILLTVPVWLTAEEAIAKVEMSDGKLQIHYTDRMHKGYMYNGDLFCAHIRLILPDGKSQVLPLPERTLYYLGALVGEEDTLLWQADTPADENAPALEADWTIRYIFWISLVLGVATMIGALTLRKKRLGKILMRIGLLPLCCAASCWFVTGGRFAMVAYDLRVPGIPNLLHIGIFAALSWLTALSVISLIGLKIREKRRVQDETEL